MRRKVLLIGTCLVAVWAAAAAWLLFTIASDDPFRLLFSHAGNRIYRFRETTTAVAAALIGVPALVALVVFAIKAVLDRHASDDGNSTSWLSLIREQLNTLSPSSRRRRNKKSL